MILRRRGAALLRGPGARHALVAATLMLLLLEQPAGGAEGVGAHQAPARRYDWFAVPLMGYNTDNGLGFGARAELARREPGVEPYRTAYMVQAYASLKAYHYHLLRFDRLGPGSERLRLTINGVYRQWGNDGYWGLGNDTTRERAFVGDFDEDDPRHSRYLYKLVQPFVHTTLRIKLTGAFASFVSLTGKWSSIEAREGSLLAEQRPLGSDGGVDLLLNAGVLYDSRLPEANPRRGLFAELSLVGGVPTPWGPGRFVGLFAALRGYHALTSWLVLAGRLMGELMLGEVPFYDMVFWHGSVPISGFGSFEAVRGYAFGRYRGPHRAMGSLELRLRLMQRHLFKRPLALQLGLFSDGGLVWGVDNPQPELPARFFPLHVGGGAGLRLIYAETFVARFDAAVADDPVREPTGQVSHALTHGLYLTFGQAF